MVAKRIVIILLSITFVVLWFFRYISLNNGLHINYMYEQVFYDKGQIVPFGNNMSSGIKYYNNLSILVDDCKIYDANEYMKILEKDKSNFRLWVPEKIIELTVTFYNNGEETEEMYFSSLQIVGDDWYEYFNSEFTAYANDIYEDNINISYGIAINPHGSYTMKIIYGISSEGRTNAQWKRIDSANMYLEISLKPVNKFIKING